jgi:hypothetical protein
MKLKSSRFSHPVFLLTLGSFLFLTELAPAQSWVTNLVDRAHRAGERMKVEQEGSTAEPAELPAPKPSPAKDEEATVIESTSSGGSPSTTSSHPMETGPSPAAKEEVSPPSSSDSSAAVPSAEAAPVVEPDSNWAILQDLLAGVPPPVGGNGPILASLSPALAANASIVPVIATPAETPSPRPTSQATRSRSNTQRNRQQSTNQSRRQNQQQSEPRRGLYNPYSIYTR